MQINRSRRRRQPFPGTLVGEVTQPVLALDKG